MLDNRNEYDLAGVLNDANARITFTQLFTVSPLLRHLCIKRLKLNLKQYKEDQFYTSHEH